MSELKVIDLGDIRERIEKAKPVYYEYYAKSEADKVIAELKSSIAPKPSDKTLQERLNEVCEKHGVSTLQDLDWAFCEAEKRNTKYSIDASNEINHQKYKRCLAMAKLCVYGECKLKRVEMRDMNDHQFWQFDNDYWLKWNERWLELAEKFKSNNEVNNA